MQSTSPKKFVFVLMPFKSDFDDTYRLGIKPACEAAGAYCERVDEQYYEGSMLDRIYNQIVKADVVISDMTGQNPNVFYETGYAHALNKKVILITQKAEDIPFDLKHFYHIIYNPVGRISVLQEEIRKRVQWFLDQPSTEMLDNSSFLKLYSHGKEIKEGELIEIPRKEVLYYHVDYYTCCIDFSVQNTSNSLLNASRIEASIIVPDYVDMPEIVDNNIIKLPDGRQLVYLSRLGEIMPNGWKRWKVNVRIDREKPVHRVNSSIPKPNIDKDKKIKIPVTTRVSSENGINEINFFNFFNV